MSSMTTSEKTMSCSFGEDAGLSSDDFTNSASSNRNTSSACIYVTKEPTSRLPSTTCTHGAARCQTGNRRARANYAVPGTMEGQRFDKIQSYSCLSLITAFQVRLSGSSHVLQKAPDPSAAISVSHAKAAGPVRGVAAPTKLAGLPVSGRGRSAPFPAMHWDRRGR